MPRCIDVILRNDLVDVVKPGDKYNFYGQLVALPDISTFRRAGEKAILSVKTEGIRTGNENV